MFLAKQPLGPGYCNLNSIQNQAKYPFSQNNGARVSNSLERAHKLYTRTHRDDGGFHALVRFNVSLHYGSARVVRGGQQDVRVHVLVYATAARHHDIVRGDGRVVRAFTPGRQLGEATATRKIRSKPRFKILCHECLTVDYM